MNIAVCDDNFEYIKNIESCFDEIRREGINIDYDVFEDGSELVSTYENEAASYDAVFLDMEMKKLNGMETASIIRKYDKHVIIVFVTAFRKYMQKSFECLPFRFLIKPVLFDDIRRVINDIDKKLHEDRQTLIFEVNRNRVRLFCDEILYCESHSHNVIIVTKDNNYQINKPLSELENTLGNGAFLRTHKSYMVNCRYIKEIRDREIVLYGTDVHIPLSRNYKKQLIEGFINFKERKFMI